jgi:hypothetical protein
MTHNDLAPHAQYAPLASNAKSAFTSLPTVPLTAMAPALRPRPPPVPSTPVAPQKPKPAPRKRKTAAESKRAAAQKAAEKTQLAQEQADALVDVAHLEDTASKKRLRSSTTVSRAADELKRSRVDEQSPPTSPGMEVLLRWLFARRLRC